RPGPRGKREAGDAQQGRGRCRDETHRAPVARTGLDIPTVHPADQFRARRCAVACCSSRSTRAVSWSSRRLAFWASAGAACAREGRGAAVALVCCSLAATPWRGGSTRELCTSTWLGVTRPPSPSPATVTRARVARLLVVIGIVQLPIHGLPPA